jgi:hypothetical protein
MAVLRAQYMIPAPARPVEEPTPIRSYLSRRDPANAPDYAAFMSLVTTILAIVFFLVGLALKQRA